MITPDEMAQIEALLDSLPEDETLPANLVATLQTNCLIALMLIRLEAIGAKLESKLVTFP